MKFSVLMSIYHKEKPEYFDRAMQSVWDEQTRKPNEIVLVQDGKLTDELYETIDKWRNELGETFKTVPLEHNVGLGDALNIGLQECSYEIVARMDTDDIALPERFERQLKIFENSDVDICSSWVSEFDDDESTIISYRKLPESHDDIVVFARKRNPINHPAVMYKKSAVLQAGGYRYMMWFEDYYLWARMIMNGARFYNIQEPLVHMRAGYAQLERRSGWKYAMAEAKLMGRLKDIGFLNSGEYLRNMIIRMTARVVPRTMVKQLYRLLRRD